jgi:hypothetical protein
MVAAYTGSSDPSMTVISTEHGPASASKDGTSCLLLLSAPPSGVLRKVIANAIQQRNHFRLQSSASLPELSTGLRLTDLELARQFVSAALIIALSDEA